MQWPYPCFRWLCGVAAAHVCQVPVDLATPSCSPVKVVVAWCFWDRTPTRFSDFSVVDAYVMCEQGVGSAGRARPHKTLRVLYVLATHKHSINC